MKKLILKSMIVIMALGGTATIANAETGSWTGSATGSKINGALYLTNGNYDRANASTQNVSQNGHEAYLQMYCYQKNGLTDPNSVRTAIGNDTKYGARANSTCKSPGIWESLHSTAKTKDPYYGLRIKI